MVPVAPPARYRHAAIPHLMVADAAAAIAFYAAAFGATELFRLALPNGRVVHAEVRVGDAVVMLGDAPGPFAPPAALGGTSVGIHVYVADVDALHARALAAGAAELQPVQDMFYGDRTAMVRDLDGHVWVLLTAREVLAPEEIVARARAAFGTRSERSAD
jgi:PhnB protein